MSRHDDFFTENPSPEHATKVMNAVGPILEERRRRQRRSSMAWLFGAGVSAVAAGFGSVIFFRGRDESKLAPVAGADLESILDPALGSSEELTEIVWVAEETDELNFDLLAELDLLNEIGDEDLKI